MKKSRAGQTSQQVVEALEALDAGRYEAAVAMLAENRSPDPSSGGDLWRAEVLLYLDRLSEARVVAEPLAAELDPEIDRPGPLGDLARRRKIVLAEIAYFGGDLEEAARLADAVKAAAEPAGDVQNVLRATYDTGRILRRQGDFAASLETLLIASHQAKRAGNPFYEGLAAYNRAACCYEVNDQERLKEYGELARQLLGETERLRYAALCDNLFGLVALDAGEFEQGMACFDRAEAVARSLGIRTDLLNIGNNAARALIARKRYDEAETRLSRVVRWEESEGHDVAEFFSLCLLSLAQCAQAKLRESSRTARLALQVAERDGNEDDVYEARLLVARSRVLTGSEEAVEELRELVRSADERSIDVHRVQSRIFLAQALIDESPVEAHVLCAEARELLVEQPGEWLTAELERVEYLISHAPIHVDEVGRLVIDTRVSWPTIKAAREAAERYIYERAITHTGGNASAAGRLIGESRYQMHHLGRILRGEAPRPSRSKAPDASAKKPKRRRSRIVYS